MSDPVNSPDHYTDGGIETIDFIRAKLGAEGFRAYCLGNAMKYVSRAGKKDAFAQDVRKAIWYLNAAVEAQPPQQEQAEGAGGPAGTAWSAGPDGWIPYDGNGCPVTGDVRVKVRLKSGYAIEANAVGLSWIYVNNPTDIAAWRYA